MDSVSPSSVAPVLGLPCGLFVMPHMAHTRDDHRTDLFSKVHTEQNHVTVGAGAVRVIRPLPPHVVQLRRVAGAEDAKQHGSRRMCTTRYIHT